MALLLLLVILTACAAIPQDLSGKMFTFPQQTNSAHVRLVLSGQDLSALTVCLRFFTDLRRDHSLFSLATPSAANAVLIYKMVANDEIGLWIRNSGVGFSGQDYKLNTWQSICATWDSASGVGQLWLDGKPSSRKYINSGSNISGPIIIVLGQEKVMERGSGVLWQNYTPALARQELNAQTDYWEQDSHGGGFAIDESFLGMMSDVQMWDYILSPSEIKNYAEYLTLNPGNMLNWRALEFQTTGRVLVEDKTYC